MSVSRHSHLNQQLAMAKGNKPKNSKVNAKKVKAKKARAKRAKARKAKDKKPKPRTRKYHAPPCSTLLVFEGR